MLVPLLVVFAIVVALPVAFMLTGAVLSAMFGEVLTRERAAAFEGSELVDLNR